MCWITDGHAIHPAIKGLLPPTGIEPTPFRNLASKVAGLKVYATTPGLNLACFIGELLLSFNYCLALYDISMKFYFWLRCSSSVFAYALLISRHFELTGFYSLVKLSSWLEFDYPPVLHLHNIHAVCMRIDLYPWMY